MMGRKHKQLAVAAASSQGGYGEEAQAAAAAAAAAVAPASSQAHLERWCRWLRCAGAFIRVLIVQLACAINGRRGGVMISG